MKRIVLNNGLKLIMKRRSHIKTVAMTVAVKAGTVNENEKNNGVAHFVEHMLFKGTKKYSQEELMEIVQSSGGIFDAITQKTYTKYEINIRHNFVNTGLDVLHDMLFNSVFGDASVNKEKGVILEEIKQQINDPFILIRVLFEREINTENPLGLCILGTEKTIKNITQTELYSFYKKYYVPNNMVLTIVGNINYEDIERKVRELFGKNKENKSDEQPKFRLKTTIDKHESELKKEGLKQTHIVIGWRAPTIFDNKKHAMEIITSILGKNMNSMLSTKFINELGIAYNIGAEFNDKEGYCFCNLAVSPQNTNLAKNVLLKLIKNLIRNGITNEELESTKNYLKGINAYYQELNKTLSEQYSIAELFTKTEEVESYDKNIDSVTVKKVNEVIRRFINVNNYIMIILKPSESNERERISI